MSAVSEHENITFSERRKHADSDAYFEAQFDEVTRYVGPGEVVFCQDDEVTVAKLGSGVFVSIYDVSLQIGAVAYVLMPQGILSQFPHFDNVDPALWARALEPVDQCLNQMKRHGAGKSRVQVTLCGGTTLPDDQDDIGTKNFVFVREALKKKGLSIFKEDLGGDMFRRIHFHAKTGRIVKEYMKRNGDCKIIGEAESNFQKNNTFYA